MSGMYPDNQDTEIFGEQVSWPGVGPDGKFTNGSFSDPMVKPSFIPAETINLILDNLESVITKCEKTPNAASKTQIASLITSLISSKTIMMRDANGRAKVAAPQEEDDIARLAEIAAHTHNEATASTPGFMSAADKLKLDGVAAGATANEASSTSPKMNGTATAGSEAAYARGDHVHPADTAKADKSNITAATKCKVTYNAQGIVTSGADLTAADIPSLAISKITDLQTKLDAKAPLAGPVFNGEPKKTYNGVDHPLAVAPNTQDSLLADLPIGTYILSNSGTSVPDRNAPVEPRIVTASGASPATYALRSSTDNSPYQIFLSGTWRSSGANTNGFLLCRRIA